MKRGVNYMYISHRYEMAFSSDAEPEQGSGNYHSDDGPNGGPSWATDVHMVFEIGEVLVFRGTDVLLFNLLKITKNVRRAIIGRRSKLQGDFLAETSQVEENIA